jgi:hypothetical protein
METVETTPDKVPGTAAERSGNGDRIWDILFNITLPALAVALAVDVGARLARRQYAAGMAGYREALAETERARDITELNLKIALEELRELRILTAVRDNGGADDAVPETEKGNPDD